MAYIIPYPHFQTSYEDHMDHGMILQVIGIPSGYDSQFAMENHHAINR